MMEVNLELFGEGRVCPNQTSNEYKFSCVFPGKNKPLWLHVSVHGHILAKLYKIQSVYWQNMHVCTLIN